MGLTSYDDWLGWKASQDADPGRKASHEIYIGRGSTFAGQEIKQAAKTQDGWKASQDDDPGRKGSHEVQIGRGFTFAGQEIKQAAKTQDRFTFG